MERRPGLTRRRAAWLLGTASAGILSMVPAMSVADTRPKPVGPGARGHQPSKPRPRLRTIVLDPGHGGADPGTIGASGFYEKNVVMVAAREMARQLAASGRYMPVLTRGGDRYIALRDRVARARSAKAELFVSVHADSHPNHWTRGASVYTLSEGASDREAAALAAKENKADIIAGVDLRRIPPDITSILIDLSQRETINLSRTFAGILVEALGYNGIGLLGRSHRHAGFAVLTAPDTPAVLLEIGYLSNRQDERLLVQPAYLRRLADGLVDAADHYFASRPPVPDGKPAVPDGPPPRSGPRPAPKKA